VPDHQHGGGNAYSHANRDFDANADCHTDKYSHTDSDRDSNADVNAHTDAD
jgi:hypothetical protein